MVINLPLDEYITACLMVNFIDVYLHGSAHSGQRLCPYFLNDTGTVCLFMLLYHRLNPRIKLKLQQIQMAIHTRSMPQISAEVPLKSHLFKPELPTKVCLSSGHRKLGVTTLLTSGK